MRRRLFCLLLGLSGSALAYLPTLSAQNLQAAYDEGSKLAQNSDSGYPLRPYTLYAVLDTLKLEAKNGAVDAVTIATPYERTRYATFLRKLGDDPVSLQDARSAADLPDHQVGFVVFAHGLTPDDQKFLGQFGKAQLVLNGKTIALAGQQHTDPSISTYPHTMGEIGIRFVGTVSYRFQIPSGLEAAKGTLTFKDASGKTFRLPVNLAQYR